MGSSKKKRQQKKAPPPVPENWDRCHAYMEQKNRFCRQWRQGSSSLYCGNHQHLEVSNQDQRKRIPCPIDPSHTIFEDQVEKHVAICPKAKKRKRQEEAIFFRENINFGGSGNLCNNSTREIADIVTWAQNLALRVIEVHQQVFQGKTNAPSDLSLSDLHSAIEMKDFSQSEFDAGIIESFQAHRIKSGGSRHIPQLASLVGHLRAIGVLPNSSETSQMDKKPIVFLEMGAGRGMLGLTAAGVAGANEIDTHLMMIERAGTRSKAEKIFRTLNVEKQEKSYLKLDKVKYSRVNCDLSHVYLPVLLEKDELKEAKVVVIAKHLCGVGTDLALKAMEPIKDRVCACVMATCCHGVCNWRGYVGRDFLREKMRDTKGSAEFGPKEFDLMRQWCAGAVACHSASSSTANVESQPVGSASTTKAYDDHQEAESEEESQAKYAVPEEPNEVAPARVNISAIVSSLQLACGVQGLGRACQRLFDYGRAEYLRKDVFQNTSASETGLFYYVPPEITPQNAVLISYKNNC